VLRSFAQWCLLASLEIKSLLLEEELLRLLLLFEDADLGAYFDCRLD
jgi:hypothetical protein